MRVFRVTQFRPPCHAATPLLPLSRHHALLVQEWQAQREEAHARLELIPQLLAQRLEEACQRQAQREEREREEGAQRERKRQQREQQRERRHTMAQVTKRKDEQAGGDRDWWC